MPRKILLFFDPAKSSLLQLQMDTLAPYQVGMQERELEIYSFQKGGHSEEWVKWKVDASHPFTFILIGKDGTEKFRSEEIIGHKKLFGLIDAMPMRRWELERKN